jgi:hypothetical protein
MQGIFSLQHLKEMLEASQCFHLYFQELPFIINITFKYYSKGSVLQTLDQSN